MSTNAGIVSDALKYVTHQKEQVNDIAKARRAARRGRVGNNYRRDLLECLLI